MSVIEKAYLLQSGEYWMATGPNSLECVRKPTFICAISQSLEFAKVATIIRKTLQDEDGLNLLHANHVESKLFERYNRLIDNQSLLGKVISSIFLWIMGYRGDSSLESIVIHRRTFLYHSIIGDEDDLQSMFDEYFQLQHLDLSQFDDLNDDNLKAVTTHYPHLQSIILPNNDSITDAAIKFFFQSCQNLKNIEIKRPISSKILKAVTENCPHLETLKVWSSEINDEDIEALAENWNKLKEIQIGSSHLTDKAIQSIAQHCSNLEKLTLPVAQSITFQGIETIITSCAELKRIKMPKKWMSDNKANIDANSDTQDVLRAL